MKKVGYVLGNKPNTCYDFFFIIDPTTIVQIDDIVITKTYYSQQEITHYGIVTQIINYTDGLQFATETDLAIKNKIPYQNVSIAQVLVTRIDPEIFVPPTPFSEVYLSDSESSSKALYFDTMQNKVPIGFLRNESNAYLNLDFLDGTNGAHMNITGMSGIATKTSFASFVVFSLLQKSPNSGQYRVVVFNVKSTDLLYLNYKNNYKNIKIQTSQEIEQKYHQLSLQPIPFQNVKVLLPPKKFQKNQTDEKQIDLPDTTVKASLYYFSIVEIFKKQLFKFFFVDEIKNYQSLERIISIVEKHMQDLIEKTDQELQKIGVIKLENQKYIQDLEDLYKYLVDYLQNSREFYESKATINAFLRRMRKIKEDCNFLVGKVEKDKKADIIKEIENNQLTVIDVHNLNEKSKLFVVSSILYLIYLKKEEENDMYKYFFVVDELNKYCPEEGETPIKEVLIDIAERGRSLGIILIGAQQTASQIDSRVISNCAIRVIGRSDSFELSKGLYHFLREDIKKRVVILKPGNMIISQPDCPVPFIITFPYPVWATRKEEVSIESTKQNELKTLLG
ncbi:MAG: ATP-binding protein [bacterium]